MHVSSVIGSIIVLCIVCHYVIMFGMLFACDMKCVYKNLYDYIIVLCIVCYDVVKFIYQLCMLIHKLCMVSP